jgi:preprotein translocase subunit SecA
MGVAKKVILLMIMQQCINRNEFGFVQALMKAFRVEDLPIESKMLTRSLDEAQKKVESYFFDIRKQLFEYDEVLNSQRDRVYTERRRALEAKNLESQMLEYAELTMDDILEVVVLRSSSVMVICT